MKQPFKRAFLTNTRGIVARALNVFDCTIWTIGSAFFWPSFSGFYHLLGAILFTVGSFISVILIVLEHHAFFDTIPTAHDELNSGDGKQQRATKRSNGNGKDNQDKLLEPLATDTCDYADDEISTNNDKHQKLYRHLRASAQVASEQLKLLPPEDAHWFLLERLLIKCEINIRRTYFLGNVLFTVGSLFFCWPSDEKLTTVACWLFVIGSCSILVGVLVELVIVENFQFKNIASVAQDTPLDHFHYRSWRHLATVSDGSLMLWTCYMYIGGCLLFIVGTFFFFPALTYYYDVVGVIMFIIGSVLFWIGAILDYIRFERKVLFESTKAT